MLNCRPFLVSGFNSDNLAQGPIRAVGRKIAWSGRNGRAIAREVLQEAAAAGLNVIRTWAHTSDPLYPLQVGGGAGGCLVYSYSAGGRQPRFRASQAEVETQLTNHLAPS